jgi:hypothetical protein
MLKLTRTFIAIAVATAFLSSSAWAATPDEDITPIEECDRLPPTASIEVFDNAKTRAVCQEMMRILDGATIADLRSFSKLAFILSVKGYKAGDYASIIREVVEIIRLRGLSNNEPRWESTNHLIWSLWIGKRADQSTHNPRVLSISRSGSGKINH